MNNVSDPKFWKDRIDESPELRSSVYCTNEEDWAHINKLHEQTLSELVPNNAKVLDAGCGYGRLFPFFQKKNCDYRGVDISPDFIELAVNAYGDFFSVGDLKKLPFEDEYFDVAFCISIQRMIERELGSSEWELIKNELLRVSKTLVVLEYSDPDKTTIYEKTE